jgi:BASS family bile acid:Na+ symporter
MLIALKLTIAALIFAIGLNAALSDVVWVWRRPLLLARSLLAMYVVIPVAAVLMTRVLDLPWGTEAALVVLAICAGAPLLPKKLAKLGGDPAYGFSLVVATSLLSIVTIPAGLQLLSHLASFETPVSPSQIAATLLWGFLLPLGAGMLVRAVLPRVAEKLGDGLFKVSGSALLVCSLVLLVAGLPRIFAVGLPSLLAFAAFTAFALGTGHVLGGPDPGERTSLAVSCATRHVGLALLVAASYRGPRTLELVAGYVFASALVSIPYVRWRRKALGAETGS